MEEEPFEEYLSPTEYIAHISNGTCEILWQTLNMEEEDAYVEIPYEINGATIIDFKEVNTRLIWIDETQKKARGLHIQIPGEDVKLGQVFRTTPWGIIKKNRTGVGATTLELRAARNSIIVLPTKSLAYSKYRTGIRGAAEMPFYCYVGSEMNELPRTSDFVIRSYVANETIRYKKFLVVADSLPRLMGVLGEGVRQVRSGYFLMLDEIDIYQSDSTFRPKLEEAIDHYFRFPPTNRCMVSATIRDFSHPGINREPIIDLEYDQTASRQLRMIHTNNPVMVVKDEIISIAQTHPDQKILVALNKLTTIQEVIGLLPEPLQSECAILCSAASNDNAQGRQAELTVDNRLPRRIAFMTCTYFVGVDIDERFHLLSVSDVGKIYTMLSPNRLTQIAGRCRDRAGALSETIIYSTRQVAGSVVSEEQRAELLKRAEAISEYLNATARLETVFSGRLPLDFGSHVDEVQGRVLYKFPGEDSISLVREQADGVFSPAYMNIDAILERLMLRYSFYRQPEQLRTILEAEEGHVVAWETRDVARTAEQEAITDLVATTRDEIQQRRIEGLIARLQGLHTLGSLTNEELIGIERQAGREERKFLSRLNALYPYLPFEQLIEREELRGNEKAYRGLHNAVILWAMEESHPFKILIRTEFPAETTLTTSEIREKADRIFGHYLSRSYPPGRENVAQQHLGTMLEIHARRSRNRNDIREIRSHNPKRLTGEPLQRTSPSTIELRQLILLPDPQI